MVLLFLIVLYSLMHMQHNNMVTFPLAEMGTSCLLDGQESLVVKCRFALKNFEGTLRRNISKFKITPLYEFMLLLP